MRLKQRYNRFVLIIFAFIWAQGLLAQKKVSFVYLDSLSYQQYLNKDWNGLIKTTRTAYQNDIDYYYMRMRTGIAFYEKHRYIPAEKHFRKAEQFNNIDKINKEYVYYSKLFSGKQKDAYLYYSENKSFLKKSVGLEKKGVTSFSIDVVYHSNLNKDVASLIKRDEITPNGLQQITLDYKLTSFKFVHDLNDYFRLIHGGSFLNKNSYYLLNDSIASLEEEVQGINQLQYYGGLSLNPGAGFNILGGIHLLHYSFPAISTGGTGFSSTYIPGYTGNFYSSRFSVYKYLGLFNFGGGVSYSNLNFKNQFQKDFRLVFYPLGNLNLYSLSNVYLVSENYNTTTDEYVSMKQVVGFKTFSNLWMEASAHLGEIKNYTSNGGFNIFNSDETQTSRYDFSLIHEGLKTNFRLMMSYSEYYNNYFDLVENQTVDLNKIELNGLTIIGEIKWKF